MQVSLSLHCPACCCTCARNGTITQSLAWCAEGWERQHSASRAAAPKAPNSGATWGPAGGKDNRLPGTHIYSWVNSRRAFHMEEDQYGQRASWPSGRSVSSHWLRGGLCGWQRDGAAPAAEAHSHPLHLPALGRQWLHLPRCLAPPPLRLLHR